MSELQAESLTQPEAMPENLSGFYLQAESLKDISQGQRPWIAIREVFPGCKPDTKIVAGLQPAFLSVGVSRSAAPGYIISAFQAVNPSGRQSWSLIVL